MSSINTHIAGIQVGEQSDQRWTTQDPKFDIQIISGVPRLVNSGHGRPVPVDVPAMTFLAHDRDALKGAVVPYMTTIANTATAEHLHAVVERTSAFIMFCNKHPDRMKQANTLDRQPKFQT